MLMRIIVTLAAVFVLGFGNGLANAHKVRRHHHAYIVQEHAYIVQEEPPVVYRTPVGARLVAHPALNIACMTPYQSTRALPCDQPVWVYGSPCEVDLGLGRSRSCD